MNPGKQPSGVPYEAMRAAIDAQTAMFRTFFMPPKANKEAVAVMRDAIVSLWKDQEFIRDYAKAVRRIRCWCPARMAKRSWRAWPRSGPRSGRS